MNCEILVLPDYHGYRFQTAASGNATQAVRFTWSDEVSPRSETHMRARLTSKIYSLVVHVRCCLIPSFRSMPTCKHKPNSRTGTDEGRALAH